MFDVAPELQMFRAVSLLTETAGKAGRVPLAWFWGEDVREAYSHWLDSMEPHLVIDCDPSLMPPDDGRICTYNGLPAYPMQALGIALKTQAEPDSGFD